MAVQTIGVINNYDIIVNPNNLEIIISGNDVEIKKGVGESAKTLFEGVFISNEDNDVPDQVGNFLRSMIKQFEKRMNNDPQYELFRALDKDPHNFEKMNDCHVDIIVQGLREHDGEFKTYL